MTHIHLFIDRDAQFSKDPDDEIMKAIKASPKICRFAPHVTIFVFTPKIKRGDGQRSDVVAYVYSLNEDFLSHIKDVIDETCVCRKVIIMPKLPPQ